MRHTPQRGKNVARRRIEVLLDALNACDEIEAVALLINDAEPANIGWPAVQSAGRAISRTARAAGLLMGELVEMEQSRSAALGARQGRPSRST